jgi:hypothetical protein
MESKGKLVQNKKKISTTPVDKELIARNVVILEKIIDFIRDLRNIYKGDKTLKKYLKHLNSLRDNHQGTSFTVEAYNKFLSKYIPSLFEDNEWYKKVDSEDMIVNRNGKIKFEIGKFLSDNGNEDAITKHLQYIYFTINPTNELAKEKICKKDNNGTSAESIVSRTLDEVSNIVGDGEDVSIENVIAKAVTGNFFTSTMSNLKEGVDNGSLDMKSFVHAINNGFNNLIPGMGMHFPEGLLDECSSSGSKK